MYYSVGQTLYRRQRSHSGCRFLRLEHTPGIRRQGINSTIISALQETNEKALGETQTLRAGRSNAKTKIFAPPQIPFPGAQDGKNLISWRWSWSLPSPSVQTQFDEKSMHAISSYRGNRPTPPARPLQTHRQDR